jgi:hypothetical protein
MHPGIKYLGLILVGGRIIGKAHPVKFLAVMGLII